MESLYELFEGLKIVLDYNAWRRDLLEAPTCAAAAASSFFFWSSSSFLDNCRLEKVPTVKASNFFSLIR